MATPATGEAGSREGSEVTSEEMTENLNVTYPDACLYCDRDGVLRTGTSVPDGMLPIARAPWLRLSITATGLALRSADGAEWVVPGVAEAGEDSDAAPDAV